jgi:hypothetical protein
MPLGIGIGQAIGLVRETRGLETTTARIVVSGIGAAALAAELAVGGDPAAVSVDGEPLEAAVAIRLLEGDPTVADTELFRRISRAGTPLLVVRRGGGGHVPHVLPEDVLDARDDLPIATLAAAIARAAPGTSPALAARLPVLRPAVARRLIGGTALTNAALAASSASPRAQLPVLAFAQSRMLLRLGLSRGDVLPQDPRQVALAAGPALAGALGMGYAARTLVRRLPVRGPLVRAAVAYAGTRALGEARLRR